MEFVPAIEKSTYDHFVQNHPYTHFMKLSNWATHKKNTENMTAHYVGIHDNSVLIATALLLEMKSNQCTYFYCPWGMCVDYSNPTLTRFFLKSIKDYVKKLHADFIRMDLNVERKHHDILGNDIDDGYNNEFVCDYFLDEGFKHKGYGYAYNGSWVNRFTLIIDISKPLDQIISNFEKRRQTYVKNLKSQGITTRLGTDSDIHYVALFEKHLSMQKGFKPKPESFFKELLTSLDNHGVFYITECNVVQYIKNIEDLLQTKKYRLDLKAAEIKRKEVEEAKIWQEKYGDHLVLAAGIFATVATHAWDIYIYSNKYFPMLHSTDSLHVFAIEDMKKRGVTSYDMVGFSGVTSKDDPYFGLYNYKKSFGSTFTEYLGEFDYIFHEKAYINFKKRSAFMNRFKRKIHSILYKKDK